MDRGIARSGMSVILLTTVAVGATAWAKSATTRNPSQMPQAAKASQAAPSVQWLQDLQAARRASRATGRPMLIVFGGPHCVYCKKLDAEVFSHPTIARYVNASFIPVHLDFEKNKRAAEILEVKSLPTSIILSPEADLLGSIEGFVQTREFAEVLHQSIEFQRTLRDERALTARLPQ
jgi:thioredoxin-related protein